MKILLILLLALSLLINAYLVSQKFIPQNSLNTAESTELTSKYPLLSSKILKDYDKDLLIHFSPLRQKLRDLVLNEYGNNITLYFEYLPTGISIGINEKIEFNAASLLKLPSVMAYYHYKERTNLKEDPMVTVEEKDIDTHFGSLWKVSPGTKVSIKDAVTKTLTESDNTAVNLIEKQFEGIDSQHVYEGLDINPQVDSTTGKTLITTKSYSSILKSLYYSSILKKENSQHILSLLNKSTLKDMLRAGVPQSVDVAHKTGVWEKEGANIYSDCGIVYVPKRPYILCIASNSELNTSTTRIKNISKEVYHFVANTTPHEKK